MNNSKSSNSESQPSPLLRSVVEETATKPRLDQWLAQRDEIASREMARRLIDQGEVLLNGERGEPSTRLRPDDVVEFRVPAPRPADAQPEEGTLEIAYEDDWLAVINKPPGLAMHPATGHHTGTLVNYLLAHCKNLSGVGGVLRPGIVHRLDKDTSGLVVVAKNDRAHISLAEQFKAHSVVREYVALVVGQPPGVAGTVSLPIGRHPTHRMKQRVWPKGREAVTHWRLEQRYHGFARLRLRLETGRTHQIRVHLAHSGWPVLCDPLYSRGRHKGLALPAELQQLLAEFGRQALHAEVLGFEHPKDGEPMRFSTQPPADMRRVEEAIASLPPPTPDKKIGRYTPL